MRNLLAATCLTPVFIAGLIAPAAADTTISTSSTNPIRTSTVKNGAADNVIVASGAALTPTSGAAITIDSNNSVTNNGSITINDKSDVSGIAATGGLSGSITNAGAISLGETATATDTDNDGDVDGPFATTTNKVGIRVTGTAPFTGTISNTGTIAVTGVNSAGISVAGPLVGNVTSTGSITTIGDNGYGVHLHDVTGAVTLGGSIAAQGANNIGVALDGNVSGLFAIEGGVTATGYRYTTAPSDTSKLDADDLLQGGPAVSIAGNVGGGVLVQVAPTISTTDTDVDKNGIPDANESTGTVQEYGAAPALRIGSTTGNITLGKVAGATGGLVIRGTVATDGLYTGVNATGVQLGGMGHTVTVTGGVEVSGAVTAASSGGNSTAMLFGSGTSTPMLTNSGGIGATGNQGTAPNVRAVEIDAGATLPAITNSGTISASLAGTNTGTAAAIRDASGTLKTITNTGTIFGVLTGSADVSATNGYALDLAANTSGITYTQSQSTVTDSTAPQLAGRIVTGSGNDVFSVSAGSVNGATNFGAGNDRLSLSGSAVWVGDTDFGSGTAAVTLAGTSGYGGELKFGDGAATLTLNDTAVFAGQLTPGTGGLSVVVNGGRLSVTNSGQVKLSQLSVGSAGAIAVNIDPSAGTHTEYVVGGNASFTSGATVGVLVHSLLQTSSTYTVLTAGTLTGGSNVSIDNATLPFLYSGSLAVGADGRSLQLTVDRKSASALGLNRAEAQAFDSVYTQLGTNDDLTGSFLGISDQDTFVSTYRQLLPITSDGIFQSAMLGSRAVARGAADPDALRVPVGNGPLSVWLQEAAWHDNKGRTSDSDPYRITGNGFTGGVETKIGDLGSVGVAASYIVNNVGQGLSGHKMFGYQYEGTAYWRGNFAGLRTNAHASFADIRMKERRAFTSTFNGDDVSFSNSDHWNGLMFTGGGSVDYRARFGSFDLTPTGSLDYYRLHEGSHGEGGDAETALSVAGRTSSEFTGTGSVTLGYGIGREGSPAGWTRLELEGGWRQVIGGSLGDTTAHFQDGDDFTITGDKLKSGYVGRIRAVGGNASLRISGEVGAEQLQSTTAVAGRVAVRLAF